MNLWYIFQFPAWCIVFITVFARLANMDRTQWTFHHHVRRFGLALAGSAAVAMLYAPFADDGWLYADSTWRGAMLGWAWALMLLTTPLDVPWADYILGVHRDTESWKGSGLKTRIKGELGALRDSFRLHRYRTDRIGSWEEKR